MRHPFTTLALAALALPLARADEPAPQPLTFSVSATSDYRFRGLSQTAKKPALQAGVDYAFSNGAYLGAWTSNINADQYPGAHMELDLYGGVKFEPAKDVGVDLGLIHVHYPNGKSTASTPTFASRPGTTTYPNTTEIYAGLSYRWFSVKYNRTLGSSLFGLDAGTVGTATDINGNDANNTPNTGTRGSGYLDLAANFEIADKLTLNLHAGHQTVANYGNYSYSDWKIGVTKEFDGFSLAVAAVGTNAKDTWWYAQSPAQVGTTNRTKIGEPGLVLSATKTF